MVIVVGSIHQSTFMLILHCHFLDLKLNNNGTFNMWYCAFHFRKGRFKTIYLILSNRYCDFPQNNVQNPNNVEGLG